MKKLQYETDNPDFLREMLSVVVPQVFGENLPKVVLGQPGDFEDGRYENWNPGNRLVVEVPGLREGHPYGVFTSERTYFGATVGYLHSAHETLEKACDWSNELTPKPLPKYQWLVTLVSDFWLAAGLWTFSPNTPNQLLNKCMERTLAGDKKKFLADFMNVEDDFDGTVEAGYRLQHRYSRGTNVLDICFTHIYYGK